QDYDFSFSMTRAVTRFSDMISGRTIRVARDGSGQFWTQVASLRRRLGAKSGRRVIICDDGIDSGRSLEQVISQLNSQMIEVAGIRVYLNPRGHSTISNVPIQTLN